MVRRHDSQRAKVILMHSRSQHSPDFVLNEVPGSGKIVTDNDGLGVQRTNDIDQTGADMGGGLLQRIHSRAISLPCLFDNERSDGRSVRWKWSSSQALIQFRQ